MQFLAHSGDVVQAKVDLLVIGVLEGATSAFGDLDKALGGALKDASKDEDFKAKAKQKLLLHTHGKIPAKRVALWGLGKSNKDLPTNLAQFAGGTTRLAKDVGAAHVLCVVPKISTKDSKGMDVANIVIRNAALGLYSFDKWRSDKGRKLSVKKVSLAFPDGIEVDKATLRRAEAMADGVGLARDLVNTPPIELYPASFAKQAQALGKKTGLSVKVFEPAELKRRSMNLLLGVGAGSSRPPRLVHLSYTPSGKGKNEKPVVLVGKGITFDSGGLSLKPPGSMVTMKGDMGGAAAVLGAMQAVATLKPATPVHGILALAENMPSGTAIRPDDVIKSAAGKTVEINNTDAEGRLVLADALHYATSLKPRCIIDLATLTGACVVALGNFTVGAFCNDDALATELLSAAKRTGEDFWRMPLTSVLREQLRSDVADMKNTGERWGGAITAALFLQEFVGDVPWAHLDIAGPAMSSVDTGNIAKGGTGVAVASLVDMLTA